MGIWTGWALRSSAGTWRPALKRSPGGDVLLLGSPTLVRWLLSRGLLDELVLTVFPIVVGSGTRLFQNMPAERVGLRLTDSRALTSGALAALHPGGG